MINMNAVIFDKHHNVISSLKSQMFSAKKNKMVLDHDLINYALVNKLVK